MFLVWLVAQLEALRALLIGMPGVETGEIEGPAISQNGTSLSPLMRYQGNIVEAALR